MSKNRIVIITGGGLIQKVLVDRPDEVDIIEIDWDGEGSEENIAELPSDDAWVGRQQVELLEPDNLDVTAAFEFLAKP